MGTLLSREAVILLGVAAALLATAGTWLRRRSGPDTKAGGRLLGLGYLLLALSVFLFILAGFRSG